jgi:hypothetical protein
MRLLSRRAKHMADRPTTNIADQTGTAFLTGPSQQLGSTDSQASGPSSESANPVVNALAVTAGKAVLDALAALGAEKNVVRLSQVADKTQLTAEVLVPLSRKLASLGLTDVTDPTSFGDDGIMLTSEGMEIASGQHLDRLRALADS